MDAVEFYRWFARYCTTSYCGACNKDGRDAEKIVREIEQWAKDHPVKTRQSEFLKMFPNAPKSGRVLDICPKDLNIEYMPPKRCENISCSACKTDYWNEEV